MSYEPPKIHKCVENCADTLIKHICFETPDSAASIYNSMMFLVINTPLRSSGFETVTMCGWTAQSDHRI